MDNQNPTQPETPAQISDNSEKVPYKQKEFEAFIQTIKGGSVAHWVQIAKALGVDQDTITAWKKLPLAQKAIEDGIEHAMEEMQKVGSSDWKMWEAKLKMLNVSPIEKKETDITSKGEKISIGVISYEDAKQNG